MRGVIDRVGTPPDGLGRTDKKGNLELPTRTRGEFQGESKSRRAGGSKDPMLEWQRDNQILIPTGVSSEQRARVEGILAGGRKPMPDDRGYFDMLLEKLRDDAGWHDYDRDERIGGNGWAVFYRVARGSSSSGLYAEALETYGPGEGVPAPDGYTLPPMKIYGVIGDSVEDEVKTEAGERITSTQGIAAANAERAAA